VLPLYPSLPFESAPASLQPSPEVCQRRIASQTLRIFISLPRSAAIAAAWYDQTADAVMCKALAELADNVA